MRCRCDGHWIRTNRGRTGQSRTGRKENRQDLREGEDRRVGRAWAFKLGRHSDNKSTTASSAATIPLQAAQHTRRIHRLSQPFHACGGSALVLPSLDAIPIINKANWDGRRLANRRRRMRCPQITGPCANAIAKACAKSCGHQRPSHLAVPLPEASSRPVPAGPRRAEPWLAIQPPRRQGRAAPDLLQNRQPATWLDMAGLVQVHPAQTARHYRRSCRRTCNMPFVRRPRACDEGMKSLTARLRHSHDRPKIVAAVLYVSQRGAKRACFASPAISESLQPARSSSSLLS